MKRNKYNDKESPLYFNSDEDIFKFIFGFNRNIAIGENVSENALMMLCEHKPDNIRIVSQFEDNKLPGTNIQLKSNGYEPVTLNNQYEVFKKKYKYYNGKKEKYTTSDFKQLLYPQHTYTKEIVDLVVTIIKHANVSDQRIADIVYDLKKVKLPREEVQRIIHTHGRKEAEKESIELNELMEKYPLDEGGVLTLDEQEYRQNKKPHLLVRLINATNKRIVRTLQIPKSKYTQEVAERFIESTTRNLNIYCIVSDGHVYYPLILKKLGYEQKRCTFHIMQSIMDKLNPPMNEIKRKITLTEKDINKNVEQIKINTRIIESENSKYTKGEEPEEWKTERHRLYEENTILREANVPLWEKKRKLKQDLSLYESGKESFKRIFKAPSEKSARRRFTTLKNRTDKLPSVFKNLINNLENYLDQAILHIENENIPNTNNLHELFHRNTNPRGEKHKKKTNLGVYIRRLFEENRWHRRVVLGIK